MTELRRPRVRPDLELMTGYHSPQIDVDVRLNTNEAPESPPEEFSELLAAELRALEWNRYPDRSAHSLRSAIAETESAGVPGGLGPDQVFAANGSNEVLQSICLAYAGAGRSVLTFEPTYALHSHIARVCGAEVLHGGRDEAFGIAGDELVRLVSENRPAITFLCSPNNPTGGVLPNETVAEALDAVESVGGLLVVDEAYGQFSPHSALALLGEQRSLVVTRTFSKTWSAAALRLGYAIGPTWLVAELSKVVLPYHLDAPKQIAGVLALRYGQEMRARVAALVEQRGRVAEGLADLAVTQWPSDANFILFRPERRRGEEVWQALVDHGVLVRNCASWPGLEDCLRVTIGTPVENDRFLDALRSALS